MGGYAIHIPDNLPVSKMFLPAGWIRTWFLTDRAIERFLLSDGRWQDDFPDLSKEEIESKSKANGLAKTLVCAQVLWFLAQCVTRGA